MQDSWHLFQTLGISLALGLLVGLQRERADSRLAGLRTFPLITLLGTVCGFLSAELGGWLLAAGLVSVMGLAVVGNIHKLKLEDVGGGLTTEVAMLLMYAVGAYLAQGSLEVGVAVGAVTAVLLHFKPELHSLVSRLGDEDIRAIMQFVLLALVILPVLPNEDMGPLDAFNPYETWLMVVLIVGLSVAGYITYKFTGSRARTVLGGLLGGLVSSTATTASYSRRVAEQPSLASQAALAIAIASVVSTVRVIVEVGVVASRKFYDVALPLAAILVWMIVLSLLLYWRSPQRDAKPPRVENPAELKLALGFAAVYALVKFAVAAAQHYAGSGAIYLVAVISGLTDLDAITLSTGQLVEQERLTTSLGWRLIMAAVMANLAFKAGIGWVLGGNQLARQIALFFPPAIVGGALLLWFWPL